MNFSLKPHQLVAHWVPGFVFLLFIPLVQPDLYGGLESLLPRGDTARGFVAAVLAFALGELLDAVRDLLENVWDRWSEVRWDFFFDGGPDQIEKLDASFFTYYVFNCNLVFPLLYLSFGQLVGCHFGWFAFGLLVACVCIADAYSLRRDIVKHTNSSRDEIKAR